MARQKEPFTLGADPVKNMCGPLRNILLTMASQFSFIADQTWQFNKDAVQRIAGRYSSEHADTFRFLPAFTAKEEDGDVYETVLVYLKNQDPHFQIRTMVDPFCYEPPWYETVHMVVGL